MINVYDIVELKNELTYIKNQQECKFTRAKTGVVVEIYEKECLVEFVDNNDEVEYLLVKNSCLKKVWNSDTQDYC